jgi:hypothetical protein
VSRAEERRQERAYKVINLAPSNFGEFGSLPALETGAILEWKGKAHSKFNIPTSYSPPEVQRKMQVQVTHQMSKR